MITGTLLNLVPRRQRLVAISMTVVFVVVLLSVTLSQVEQLLAKLDRLGESRVTLGRMQAIAAADAKLERQLLPPNEENPAYLPGENEAAATAALQAWIQEIVLRSGGQVNSTSNIVEPVAGKESRVGLALNFTGGMETISATVSAIESNRPRLIVKAFTVHSDQQQLLENPDTTIQITATVNFVGAYETAGRDRVSE